MSNAVRLPQPITVEEFQDWVPPAGLEDRRWLLVNGEPVCMAPAGEDHGAIQATVSAQLWQHLRAQGGRCRVITTPGLIPRVGSRTNQLVPDVGVTCTPALGSKTMRKPVLLVEIISPSNRKMTERNILAYATIPSVREILSLDSLSVAGKLYRRDAEGDWEDDPETLERSDWVRLTSIGFKAPIVDFYATSSLAQG